MKSLKNINVSAITTTKADIHINVSNLCLNIKFIIPLKKFFI